MAAINKNFVVKNGIEVGDNLIFGNKDQLRVGIGTTVPGYTLDVRGGIGATSVSVGQTLTANSGIITTLTASNVTITTLNATGVAATAIQSTWFQVGSGLTFTTGIATNFTVSGIATFGSNIGVTGVTTSKDLKVVGIATIETLDVQTKLDVYDSEAVFHNNVRIDGNLSIGGTTTTIVASDLRVTDRDIVLGVTTNSFGADISNDTTANHGGIAIASTEGSPLVDLVLTGFSTLPSTYKQMMWVKADSYGFGTTDAFLFNYAVGIGSTLVPNGVRLAVSNIHFTDDTITSRNVNVTNGLNVSGALTATAIRSTWSQVGLGLTFTSGIGTNLNISGITTTNSLYIDATEVISSARQLQNIASLDATTTATIETAIANAPNTFTDLTVTGIATFNNNVGVAGIITATAIQSTWSQVGLGLTFTSGIGTNLIISGIASVGSGITLTSSGDARYAGIITAQKFVGDGSELTGTISGVGIKSDGVTIGTGVTFIDFTGPGVSTVTVSVGIATINFEGGGGGGGSGTTIDKQTFNVGVGGTNLLTLSNSYTIGNIDIYVNGIKLSPGDFSELTGTTVGLTTTAVSGDVIDIVSFRAINNGVNSIGIQSGGVSIGATFSTLNFIGSGSTFRDNGNGIVDISIKPPEDTFITNLRVSGIETATKLHVGIATTFSETLVVSGNARVTGILTIGTGSITLNGSTDTITVGTGATIFSSGDVKLAGIITATSLSIGGRTVSSVGVGINTSGGNVGYGATLLDFRGAGISTITVAAGIATINITGGGGGGASVSISTTAPVSPSDGDLWYDNSDGNTYIWYNSQNVWVVSQTYGY